LDYADGGLMNSFAPDMIVTYHHITGPIKFVSNQYITVCINSHLPKQKQTNILIPHKDWKQVSHIKDSQK
jgi:hypothetical protein